MKIIEYSIFYIDREILNMNTIIYWNLNSMPLKKYIYYIISYIYILLYTRNAKKKNIAIFFNKYYTIHITSTIYILVHTP